MKTILSGQLGLAVLDVRGHDAATCTVLKHNGEPVQMPRSSAQRLLNEATDLVVFEMASIADAQIALDLAWRKDSALRLAFIVLTDVAHDEATAADDPDFVGPSVAACLESALAEAEVFEFVLLRLLSNEMPPTADLAGALRVAKNYPAGQLSALLNEIIAPSTQQKIHEVCSALKLVPDEKFAVPEWDEQASVKELRDQFENVLLTENFIGRLVCDGDKPDKLMLWQIDVQNHRRLKRYPQVRKIVFEWLSVIRQERLHQ